MSILEIISGVLLILSSIAIIILVLVVQACIFQLFYKKMQSMRKMKALAPKMQRIQNKY